MRRYKTVQNAAEAEQTIEKSRFIAHVKPIETKEAADAYVAEIRARHKGATHNVPVMVIGEKFETQWASDDGEPQGTAGVPILQMLVKEGVTNVVVVVTRYYGGTKLGTGGLVRAYTGSAKLGISAAGICYVRDVTFLTIKTDYVYLNKIQNISQKESFDIKEIIYEDMVILRLVMEPENVPRVKECFAGISAGTYSILSEAQALSKCVDDF